MAGFQAFGRGRISAFANIDQLAESVQAAATGPLAAKVRYFFEPKHPGEEISGMGRFELNLALARIADLDAAEKDPRIRRREVEDVMSYHDADRATCLHNTTAAFPTWCY